MGEGLRIGEPPVHHHRTQRAHPRLGEEQLRQPLFSVKPHQTTRNQPLHDGRQLGLASLRAAAPAPEQDHSPATLTIEEALMALDEIKGPRFPGPIAAGATPCPAADQCISERACYLHVLHYVLREA